MKTDIRDFVLVADNFIGEEYCNRAIQYFESMSIAGYSTTRKQHENANKTNKDDSTIFISDETVVKLEHTQFLCSEFFGAFWNTAYPQYASRYDILQTADTHSIYGLRLQKTDVGGGYHSWHFENAARANSSRLMAFILYLNEVFEGGETEFLYYPKRVKPEAGRFLMFPAGFSHTHRGNPPISNDKYIITGWVEF